VTSRQPAEGYTEAHGKDHGSHRQLESARKADQESVGNLAAVDEARSEVTLQQPPDVVEVLLVEGLVESLSRIYLGDQLRCGVLAEDRLRRSTAGQQA